MLGTLCGECGMRSVVRCFVVSSWVGIFSGSFTVQDERTDLDATPGDGKVSISNKIAREETLALQFFRMNHQFQVTNA